MYGAREAMGVPSPTTVNDDGSHNVAKHMGPNVGGLPGFSQFEAFKEAEAQRAITENRARYIEEMDKAYEAYGAGDETKKYAATWNPETKRKDLPDALTINDSDGAAYARNQKDKNGLTPYRRRIARQTENFDAGRAAHRSRRYGFDPALARGGIETLDAQNAAAAAGEEFVPTDYQRETMGLPPMNNNAALAENRTLHASAIGQYLAQGGDPDGLPAVIGGLESSYPTRSNTGNAGPPPTPDPSTQPTQEEIDMIASGNSAGADASMARRATWDIARTRVKPEYQAAFDEAVTGNDDEAIRHFLLRSGVPEEEVFQIMIQGTGNTRYSQDNPSGSLAGASWANWDKGKPQPRNPFTK